MNDQNARLHAGVGRHGSGLRRISVWTGVLLAMMAPLSRADLVLETETAQLGKKGEFNFSTGMQFEREKDGSTRLFTLNQFEYAVTDRAEILIEPFFFEYDHPAHGRDVAGEGDLEITPSYMIAEEGEYTPAVVLSFKVKIPTASNEEIGTRKFDYQPFVIIGKTFGPWIVNANLGYDFISAPDGETLKNQIIADLSVERILTSKFSVFAETFANTSPARNENGTWAVAVAAEYKLSDTVNVFASVGYDTDHLAAVRVGFNYGF